MTDSAVISGTYSDFKIIKTRSVVQIIVEVPIERAKEVIDRFGIPQPGKEKWVALALLRDTEGDTQEEAPKEDKPKRKWEDMQPAVQAGILVNDPNFIAWTERAYPEIGGTADERIKAYCGVQSKTELSGDTASVLWGYLVDKYREETRETAEIR